MGSAPPGKSASGEQCGLPRDVARLVRRSADLRREVQRARLGVHREAHQRLGLLRGC